MLNFKKVATVINNNQPGWTNIVGTAPHVTLDIGTELYVKEKIEVIDVVLDLLQKDGHQFSARPCQTCQTITNLVGKPFGCVTKAKAARDFAR